MNGSIDQIITIIKLLTDPLAPTSQTEASNVVITCVLTLTHPLTQSSKIIYTMSTGRVPVGGDVRAVSVF